MKKKVLLCVFDGFGEGKPYAGNAILNAQAPFLKELKANYPWTLLDASGESVGIPAGTQGGSEVGHLTMGAGRVIYQPLLNIDKSIETKEFFKKPALLEAAARAKKQGRAFHILGMISDQGVHADVDHALALLDFAKQEGLTEVYVHGIADGRDVPPKSMQGFVDKLELHMQKIGVGKLASLVGRNFAMDRDQNLDRTRVAYDLYTQGKGKRAASATEAIQNAYAAGLESDYFFEPTLLDEHALMHAEDSVVFFNFRTDRAAQLTEMLVEELKPHLVVFGAYTTKAPNVFPPLVVENNLGAVLSRAGLKQLRVAETEKYAHVTFFFNSQEKEPYPGEDRIMLNSAKVGLFNEKPEMQAREITDALLDNLNKDYAFIAVNYANLDLVGHSGDYAATVKAMEVLDECLARLVPAALQAGYTFLLTGDHGNAEYMLYEETNEGCPSHTKNPVPLIVVSEPKQKLKNSSHTVATGGLKDLAPSILTLLGMSTPSEMTGEALF